MEPSLTAQSPAGITVVIPAFNAEQFIAETLRSVFQQTRQPDEVIVVDDSSTDATARIATDLGARVISAPGNGGAARARNMGVKASTYSLIAFLDADDIWLPGHLESLAGLLQRLPESVLAFSRVVLFGRIEWTQEETIAPGAPAPALWHCAGNTVAFPSGVMIRKETFLAVGGFDESLRFVEDFEFGYRAAQLGPFVCSHDITARYRKHAQQTSLMLAECTRTEYDIRSRWIAEGHRKMSAQDYAKLVEIQRRRLDTHILEFFRSRNTALLSLVVRAGARVPQLRSVVTRHAGRLLVYPVLPLLDRLRGRNRARALTL